VQASDVSLARELFAASTILIILPARIVAGVAQDGAQINLVLRLGAAGQGAALLARVTRKSWRHSACDQALMRSLRPRT
jgi:molybdate transport system ATP-binding protein